MYTLTVDCDQTAMSTAATELAVRVIPMDTININCTIIVIIKNVNIIHYDVCIITHSQNKVQVVRKKQAQLFCKWCRVSGLCI